MARPRHPKGEIEDAVRIAERRGWSVKMSNGHCWGRLYCPHHTREGCMVSVWSTPKSPWGHAKTILRAVERCPQSHRGWDDETT
jgi:hypothetical protein